jgi:hypothetical protein
MKGNAMNMVKILITIPVPVEFEFEWSEYVDYISREVCKTLSYFLIRADVRPKGTLSHKQTVVKVMAGDMDISQDDFDPEEYPKMTWVDMVEEAILDARGGWNARCIEEPLDWQNSPAGKPNGKIYVVNFKNP